MGPIVPHVGLNYSRGADKKQEVEIHENLVYEKDINIGSRTVFSIDEKKISEA
jgi:hypothetical protein